MIASIVRETVPSETQLARLTPSDRQFVRRQLKSREREIWIHLDYVSTIPGHPDEADDDFADELAEIDEALCFLAVLDYREP